MKRSCAKWRVIGDRRMYMRSNWEWNFALVLEEWLWRGDIIRWEYEPKTFWYESIRRGVRSYKPDFQVYCKNGEHIWYEVKGYLDSKSKTKIKRFRKYYPEEKLIVLAIEWIKILDSKYKHLIGWEPIFKKRKIKKCPTA